MLSTDTSKPANHAAPLDCVSACNQSNRDKCQNWRLLLIASMYKPATGRMLEQCTIKHCMPRRAVPMQFAFGESIGDVATPHPASRHNSTNLSHW